uniref:Hexosyltransferase n=1 Tax=Eptatretus burgeri TaxID=7764 RepID=A0A8C4QCV6_EPTBU
MVCYRPTQVKCKMVSQGLRLLLIASQTIFQQKNYKLTFIQGDNPKSSQWRLDRFYNPVLANHSFLGGNFTVPDIMACQINVRAETEIAEFNKLPPHFRDFVLYQNCRHFPQILDAPEKCSSEQDGPFLLFAIKSSIGHFDRRQAIRESWGQEGVHRNNSVRLVFLLGRTKPEDHQPDLQDLLELENHRHGDLLQWDFRDTFFNLTLKELLFLDWLEARCPHVRFLFKGDDDVFVNTNLALAYLANLTASQAQNLFIGDVILKAGPVRDTRVKYYIPPAVFDGGYPPYAGGGGYIYSGALAKRIRRAAHQVFLFPIDDVFMGMCLAHLGLSPIKHSGFRTFDIKEKDRRKVCAYRNIILVHSRQPGEVIGLWLHISCFV